MAITLQTLITESADYVKADLDDDDDRELIENRLRSALNEAKNIIAQRLRLKVSEKVTLDENSCFNVETLSQGFWGLVSVRIGDSRVSTQEQNGLIWCSAAPFETVTVEYEYIPKDMVEMSEEYPFPSRVSWRLLCYYAAARYYEIKGTATSLNKYRYWMNEWESGTARLRGGLSSRRRVKAVYNFGEYSG